MNPVPMNPEPANPEPVNPEPVSPVPKNPGPRGPGSVSDVALTVGQRSLLRAARLIYLAHDRARADTARVGGVFPSWLEQDCATLLLLAVSLLPDGLPLEGAAPSQSGCVDVLAAAEAELRRLPIYAYPPGTSRLVVVLCDVLAAAGEQSRP